MIKEGRAIEMDGNEQMEATPFHYNGKSHNYDYPFLCYLALFLFIE